MKFNLNNIDKNNSKNNYLNRIYRNLKLINNNYNKRFWNNYNNTIFKSNTIENYTLEDPAYVASTSSRNKRKGKIIEFENFDKNKIFLNKQKFTKFNNK